MKIHVAGPYNSVTKIEFCCGDMAKDILLGVVTTRPWTDHALGFWVRDDGKWNGYRLSHCGHCGAKIQGEVFGENFYTRNKE